MNQAHLQYVRECAVRARNIISTSEDFQYKQVHHEVLEQGGGALLKNSFD